METKGVADAVAAIRQYWGSDREFLDEDLFAIALRQWRSDRESGNAANDFVLQVVACRLEEQLRTWLLQSHATDAVEDIQELFDVCTDPYFVTNGLELLETLLGALVTAAIVRAAASDRSAENRMRRIAEILDMMEEGMLMNSKALSVLRALGKCEESAGAWTQFLEFPNVLDSRLFNSRRGQAFMDKAEQVISMQQVELASARGPIERCDGVELEGLQPSTANVLWDITTQLVELIKTKADPSDVQGTNGVEFDTTLVVVESMMDLEEYLKGKGSISPPCGNDSSDHEINFDGEDVELSAIEQLSSICSSSEEEPIISSDILEKAFDELSAMKRLDIISIQTSFLLGLQMRRKLCFLDRCESAKDEFVRRIKRVFNRLTGKAQDLEHAASLVILAAFCPRQVIQQCIRGSRIDVMLHNLYLKVLRTSPLLLDWNEDAEDGRYTLFECELQQTLLDVSSNQSSFDRESQNVMSFLLSVVGISKSTCTSSKRDAPVVTMSKLLDGVINPVFCCTSQSVEMQFNLYTLIQQLFQHFVTTNAGRDLDCTVLESSFNLVLGALCSPTASDPRFRILIHERLLLLLKNTMELMPDPASIIVLEQLDSLLNPSLWTLLGLFNSDLGNDKLCKGLEDVASVEAYMQEKSVGDSLGTLPLPNVISAIQVLLWGLLWNSTLSGNVSVESTKAETWRLLDVIAGYEFVGLGSVVETIKGSLLIQSAVAEMMLECGSVLFQVLLGRIIPYLLEYEPTESETSLGEKLAIPKWAADKLSKEPKVELQIPCRLVSTHSVMRYVARCWGLLGAVNTQLQGSLSGTLFCIQWVCFLVSAACELHLDTISTWSTVRTQFELLLLRLLHQLEQQKGMSTSEAHFSQHFVAAWLAYLPAGQFDQVFNFVASRTYN